jgi:hypothetical protein
MQIEVGRVAAPKAGRDVRRHIEAVAHSPLATLGGPHPALPATPARQRRLDYDAVTLGDFPTLGSLRTDLLNKADRLVTRNDRQLAGADLELAEILIIIGATEAIGLDAQQTVIRLYLGQSEVAQLELARRRQYRSVCCCHP